MGLRFKFNLVLALVFAAGLLLAALVLQRELARDAREEVVREARLMMESALAVRTYTVDQVRPLLLAHTGDAFLPQTVPAYAATETFAALRLSHPDYSYKEAVLNPTNPRDQASGWEAAVVQRFRAEAGLRELVDERESAGGRMLAIARPIQVTSGACLQCHSVPAAAPAGMLQRYGSARGFGWRLGETVGAQLVSVPMALPLARAERALQTFMASLALVFAGVFLALNLMLSWLIVSPVRKLSAQADRLSTGEADMAEMEVRGRDEIASLALSFNRLHRSLAKAMHRLGAP